MLQIRLSKQPTEPAGASKPSPADAVTVACPDHLVLADLPVAKGIGAPNAATVSNTVGRRSRRLLGERVHFCVRCDFPIAIYGRLSPCDHAFCLDCARSDSICYLCDEGIQKIQSIKLMEGIFVCAAPHCLKSFFKMDDFTSHIHESHSELLQSNLFGEDVNEQDVQGAKQGAMDLAFRGPPRSIIPSGVGAQNIEEEKGRRLLPLQRPMMPSKQPIFGQMPNFYIENQAEGSRPGGFDRAVLQNHYHMQQDSGQFADKPPEVPSSEFPPMHSSQPPNYAVPMDPTAMATPQYGMPPFHPDGGQPMYGSHYDIAPLARPDAAPESGTEQASVLGFPPGPVSGVNYMGNYPQPWTPGTAQGRQGIGDGFGTTPDTQGNVSFFHGDYGRGAGAPPRVAAPPGPPLSSNKSMEVAPGGNQIDPRGDGRGTIAPYPFQHHLPPPQLSHIPQSHRSRPYSSDRPREGQGYGWQHENRDGFGNSQE